MIIRKPGIVLDVDIEGTARYSREHSLCECNEDRNFYAQARDRFPKLTEFLGELGLLIERPDEISSVAMESYIDYLFVAYTVIGQLSGAERFETEMDDGGLRLKIVIDRSYIPNEQETKMLFTVTVYHIDLPWVLDEPFPESDPPKKPFWSRFFH